MVFYNVSAIFQPYNGVIIINVHEELSSVSRRIGNIPATNNTSCMYHL